jgi:putative oxidoreductase
MIQLTVPDGWANFHLPWASMALAIMTFGPGKAALDYALELDRGSRAN